MGFGAFGPVDVLHKKSFIKMIKPRRKFTKIIAMVFTFP
jgi:hypothetical protein